MALAGIAAVLQKLEAREGGDSGDPETAEELAALGLGASAGKLGVTQIERLKRSRELRPDLTVSAHEKELMTDLAVLPGESWSYGWHAEQKLLPQA